MNAQATLHNARRSQQARERNTLACMSLCRCKTSRGPIGRAGAKIAQPRREGRELLPTVRSGPAKVLVAAWRARHRGLWPMIRSYVGHILVQGVFLWAWRRRATPRSQLICSHPAAHLPVCQCDVSPGAIGKPPTRRHCLALPLSPLPSASLLKKKKK
ncbi:hypothetical protein F4861DRAFT_513814, partial [Xylaria intraflava]